MRARYSKTVAQTASGRKGARRGALLAAAALACLSLLLLEARGATAIAATLEQLIDGADTVVVGKVVAIESRWNAEHTKIYTYTTLEVEEYLKGDGPSTVTIRALGGQVDDKVMYVEGIPRFQLDRREAVFLETFAPEADTFSIRAWEQGRFRVLRDPDTGQDMLQRSLSGTRLVRGAQSVSDTSRQFGAIQTLDDLRTAVRSRTEGR